MYISENTTLEEDLRHINEMAETLRKETDELLKGKETFLKAIRAVEDKHTIKIN